MNRRSNLIFILLAVYVVLQFIWWAFQLIQLHLALDGSSENERRIVAMIVGEGTVFILILGVGLWQIRKAIHKEIELSKRQSNFLLSITHELKTPLAANKLAFQTLLKRTLAPEIREQLIRNALIESERLETLIENLLNASRIDNKAMTPLLSSENMNELIGALVDNAKKIFSNKVIHLQIEKNIIIRIDSLMIYMVLNNLLENAIKYSETDSIVEIKVHQKNKKLLIEIIDQGIGINTSDRPFIFDKFYRAGDENTRQKSGTGLGLFIANEFVKKHGGSILYKPNQPKGSIFTVILPDE